MDGTFVRADAHALASWLGVSHDVVAGLPDALLDSLEIHRRRDAEQEREIEATRSVVAELLSESRVDPLTGAASRRAFDERLTLECARAFRTGRPLAVLAIDVDGLKQVNDTFGHPAGDELLSRLVAILRDGIRQIDLVGRVGGDEFAMILPETDETGVRQMAERLTAAVAGCELPNVPIRPAISVGYSISTPQRPRRPSELVDEADRALYQGRHARRPSGSSRAALNSRVGDAVA